MNYTIAGNGRMNKRINDKVQADMDYISGRVADLLGDRLHAILLCGGFGRGEGSVVVDEDRIHIVNDYDFTIVLNSKNRLHYLKIYKEIYAPLELLAVELAEDLDIKQVDLSPKPLSYFTKEKHLKIENYEVRQGHVLLYGDQDPTGSMPCWQAEDIPLFEGAWLFRNRGTGLLLAALYFQACSEFDASKKENFIIECNKAHLAMGDAVLLLNRSYHHLYHKRYGVMKQLDLSNIPSGEDVKDRYREALNQKLYPDFNRLLKKDLKGWWFDVTRSFEKFFKFYEQERLGVKFENWIEYAELAKPEDRPDIKVLAAKFIKAERAGISLKKVVEIYRKSKKSFSISLIPLVLFSLHEDSINTDNSIDKAMVNKAAELLNLNLSGEPKQDWLMLAKAVLNEIHPGGEVAAVLAGI